MANPVVHFEIIGKNGPKLREFYKGVFDWTIHDMSGGGMDYGMVHADEGKGIGGGIGQGDRPTVIFYLEVPDINAYLKKVEAKGGKTVQPRTVIPNAVTFAHFSDPEGNVVGLTETGGGG
jgi:predicted enzyme related to lactoylglutathione lyase